MELPLPPNEEQRLQSLYETNLLDTPLEARFERITRMACRLLDVPIAAFTVMDRDRQFAKSIQGSNYVSGPRADTFCQHMLAWNTDHLVVNNARHDPRFADNPFVKGEARVTFYAGTAVRAPDGSKIGALCAIDRHPREMSAEDLQTLRDLAALIETELKAEHLHSTQKQLIAELDQAHRASMVDDLTRIWNRAGILELLRRESAESKRRQQPLSIVMADIDYFKKVNDTHGHPVGDEVIRAMGKRLLGALRAEDAVGRMGGEEFMLLLPSCPPEDLNETVERIRHNVTAEPVLTAAGPLPVTLSLGAVSAIVGEEGPEVLIRQADEALYRAKHAGRNRSEIVFAA